MIDAIVRWVQPIVIFFAVITAIYLSYYLAEILILLGRSLFFLIALAISAVLPERFWSNVGLSEIDKKFRQQKKQNPQQIKTEKDLNPSTREEYREEAKDKIQL
jgi:predicted membrane protein